MTGATDILTALLQRSYFTVKNGHVWGAEDHELLVQSIQQLAADGGQAVFATLGKPLFVVLEQGTVGADVTLRLVGTAWDEAAALALASDTDWEPRAADAPDYVHASGQRHGFTIAIWCLQLGGTTPSPIARWIDPSDA